MTEKHSEYDYALDEHTQGVVDDIFSELHDELDHLEGNMSHSDLALVVLAWVRERVTWVSENYKNK